MESHHDDMVSQALGSCTVFVHFASRQTLAPLYAMHAHPITGEIPAWLAELMLNARE